MEMEGAAQSCELAMLGKVGLFLNGRNRSILDNRRILNEKAILRTFWLLLAR